MIKRHNGFHFGSDEIMVSKLLKATSVLLFTLLTPISVHVSIGGDTMQPTTGTIEQEELLGKLLIEVPPRKNILGEYKEKIDSNLFYFIFSKALQVQSQGKIKDAFTLCDLATEIAEFLKDEALFNDCHGLRGHLLSHEGKDMEAIQELEKFTQKLDNTTTKQDSFPASSPIGVIFWDLYSSHWRLGATARAQNNTSLVKEHFLKAIETWKMIDFNTEEEKMLYNLEIKNFSLANVSLGNIYFEEQKLDKALEFFEQALSTISFLKPQSQLDIHLGLSQIYIQLNRFPDAIKSLKNVVELGDESDKALAYMQMGMIHKLRGSYVDAGQCYRLSVDIYKKIEDKLTDEDKLNLAQVYQQLSNYEFAVNNYERAKEDQKEALRIIETLDYPEEEVQIYTSFGQNLLEIGEYDQSLSQFKKALETATHKVKNNNAIILDCHLNLCFAYSCLRRLNEAEKEFQDADAVFDKVESTFKNKADKVKYRIKMWNKASELRYGRLVRECETEYLEEAIKLCEEDDVLKASIEYASALKARGIIRLNRKQFKEAEGNFKAAITIFKNNGLLRHEVNCLQSLVQVYMENKDFGKVVESLAGIKEQLRKEKATDIIAAVNGQIALAYFHQDNPEKALKVLEEDEITGSQMWWSKWIKYLALGGVLEKKGDLDNASKNYAKAIEHIEGLRQTLKLEETRTGFIEGKTIAYCKIVEVLYKLERFEEAFEYAERARCRIFTEQLGLTKLRRPKVLESTPLGKELTSKEDELIHGIMLILSQTRNSSIDLQGETTKNLAEKEEELSKVWTRIEEKFKNNNSIMEYLSLRRGDTVKVKELSKIIQKRFHDASIVEYFPGKCNNEEGIFIFVMGSKDGKIKAKHVPISVTELNKYIGPLKENIIKEPFTYSEKDWRKLGKYLIDPIKEHIKGYKVLCMVPYGDLSYVPMHALYTEAERYVIETHAVVYYPSASILKYINNQKRKNKKVMIIGNPTKSDELPFSEYEAIKVGSLFKEKDYSVEVYTGEEAKKDLIARRGKWLDGNIIHLSCHGEFKEEPLDSSIIFADDTLTARDVYDMSLKTNLVVLSACETAKSTIKAGEIYGLPRAFLYAGTSSLMCTLWKVSDLSTSMLIEKFYEELLNSTPSTINKAEALRRAQKFLVKSSRQEIKEYLEKAKEELKKKHKFLPEDENEKINNIIEKHEHPFEDPYYWAPFILIGNWYDYI